MLLGSRGGEAFVVGLELLVVDVPHAPDASAPAAIARKRLLRRHKRRRRRRIYSGRRGLLPLAHLHRLLLLRAAIGLGGCHGARRVGRRGVVLAEGEAKAGRRAAAAEEEGEPRGGR